MKEIDEVSSTWDELCGISADPPVMRDKCTRCYRPMTVCWCPFLPKTCINIKSNVIILQHPAEEKRCLRTVPMLQLSLVPDKCSIYKGKKFPSVKHDGLQEIFEAPNTLVLYPSKNSIPIDDVICDDNSHYNLIILDGTWSQAKAIYNNSTILHNLKQVRLKLNGTSEYIIRTQPNEGCLSTLEATAQALSVLEKMPYLRSQLISPLQALCTFQLNHGAVPHQSKEYLLSIGKYHKAIGRKTKKRILKNCLTASNNIENR